MIGVAELSSCVRSYTTSLPDVRSAASADSVPPAARAGATGACAREIAAAATTAATMSPPFRITLLLQIVESVFEPGFQAPEELERRHAVGGAVIERQADRHHRSHRDPIALEDDRALLNRAEADDRHLRLVEN